MVKLNLKRLRAVGFEAASHAQPTEAPRIDKAQFPPRSQLGDQVGMLCDLTVRRANQHAARHSQVDDPLGRRLWLRRACARACFCLSDGSTRPVPPPGGRGRPPYAPSRFQVEYDVLSYPAHSCNALGLERRNNLGSRRFQRLRLRSQPDRFDDVSCNPRSQPPRDSFNFRQFRHEKQSTVVSLRSSAFDR